MLVVTDVAARGIDVPLLDNVVHFDFPAKPKLFVHRCGRAARAGRSGTAVSLVEPDEMPYLYDVALYLGRPVRPVPSEADAVDTAGEVASTDDTIGGDAADTSVGEAVVLGRFPLPLLAQEVEYVASVYSESDEVAEMARVAARATQVGNGGSSVGGKGGRRGFTHAGGGGVGGREGTPHLVCFPPSHPATAARRKTLAVLRPEYWSEPPPIQANDPTYTRVITRTCHTDAPTQPPSFPVLKPFLTPPSPPSSLDVPQDTRRRLQGLCHPRPLGSLFFGCSPSHGASRRRHRRGLARLAHLEAAGGQNRKHRGKHNAHATRRNKTRRNKTH